MARDKAKLQNINLSDLVNYPNGRIADNTGAGDGTPVSEVTYGDIHETYAKLMRLSGLKYNDLPDNEENGYQLVEAIRSLPSKNDLILNLAISSNVYTVPLRMDSLIEGESFILKATVAKSSSTSIRGTLDNKTKSVSVVGDFKVNEYVRMLVTSNSILITRLIDAVNLNSAVNDLLYLKAATSAQDLAGTLINVALTPKSSADTYANKTIGATSGNFLATTARNGHLSKEDKLRIDNLASPEDLIKVDSGTKDVENFKSGRDSANPNNNFSFNYADVFLHQARQ